MSQAWGILFSAQRRNLKKMRESLEDKVELLSQPVVDALIQMIDSVARLDKEIEALESVMKDQLSCRKMQLLWRCGNAIVFVSIRSGFVHAKC